MYMLVPTAISSGKRQAPIITMYVAYTHVHTRMCVLRSCQFCAPCPPQANPKLLMADLAADLQRYHGTAHMLLPTVAVAVTPTMAANAVVAAERDME